MTLRSLGHRAPLLWLALPFAGGLLLGKSTSSVPVAGCFAVALTGAIAAIPLSARRPTTARVAIAIAMFAAGTAAYPLHRGRLAAWQALPPREARLEIEVEHSFTAATPQRISGIGRVTSTDAHLRELRGQRIYYALQLPPRTVAPIRSGRFTAIGVLAFLPAEVAINTFDGYLDSIGVNYRFTRGRWLGPAAPATVYYRFCDRAAQRFREILGLGIGSKRPALTGLLRAMMLGDVHDLTAEQHTLFMESGTMHLFAISGLNIGVISTALQALFVLARVPQWPRFLIGSALLWLFVDITGGAPSAVRAFMMAVFFQLAFLVRRPVNALAAIVASMFAVLVLAPLQLFTASFLMSYCIVIALLTLGLPLGEACLERWTPWRDLPPISFTFWQRGVSAAWRALIGAAAIGVATSLVGLITGVQFFGLLTPGSLVTNLVLIPTASGVTIAGFASLLGGLLGCEAAAAWCNHAAALLLLVLEKLVRASVAVPGAFVNARFVAPWIGPTALVAVMASLWFGYAVQWQKSRGGFWPPFAIAGVVLVFGVSFGT